MFPFFSSQDDVDRALSGTRGVKAKKEMPDIPDGSLFSSDDETGQVKSSEFGSQRAVMVAPRDKGRNAIIYECKLCLVTSKDCRG